MFDILYFTLEMGDGGDMSGVPPSPIYGGSRVSFIHSLVFLLSSIRLFTHTLTATSTSVSSSSMSFVR